VFRWSKLAGRERKIETRRSGAAKRCELVAKLAGAALAGIARSRTGERVERSRRQRANKYRCGNYNETASPWMTRSQRKQDARSGQIKLAQRVRRDSAVLPKRLFIRDEVEMN